MYIFEIQKAILWSYYLHTTASQLYSKTCTQQNIYMAWEKYKTLHILYTDVEYYYLMEYIFVS